MRLMQSIIIKCPISVIVISWLLGKVLDYENFSQHQLFNKNVTRICVSNWVKIYSTKSLF